MLTWSATAYLATFVTCCAFVHRTFFERILREKDQLLQEKDQHLQEKDQYLQEKDKEKHTLAQLKDEIITVKEEVVTVQRKRIDNLTKELLEIKGSLGVVFVDSSLIEIGLNFFDRSNNNVTRKWDHFAQKHVFENKPLTKLTDHAKDVLTELGCQSMLDVAKVLVDLLQELNNHEHRISGVKGHGLVCGGAHPLGCATGLVILLLQDFGGINFDVRFVDEQMRDKKLLRCGLALEPTGA